MGLQDLKKLPSIDQILTRDETSQLLERYPRKVVLLCLNELLAQMRTDISADDHEIPSREELISTIINRLENALVVKTASTLKKVVNATGTIIHTNLGRSILSSASMEALAHAGDSYTTLEYDLAEGKRGSRHVHCEQILRELTGCEAALVVNNNAAAVLLTLNTLSFRREAVVSRGELVEIGGSFRIPEVMEKSGAIMVEVGSTNRTRLSDFERVINENTALLTKVHRSNFTMVGFVEEVDLADLVSLGRDRGVAVLHDLGSGLLIDLSAYGLRGEPIIADSLKAGADVLTVSGDKLLGGPQAGIILGKKEVIDRIRTNPMTRALRVDKLTIAALEATLKLYYDPEKVLETVPTLRMITTDMEVLHRRAAAIVARIGEGCAPSVEIREGDCAIGGGSFPGVTVRSVGLHIVTESRDPNELESLARAYEPAILGRIKDNEFILDMRTIAEEDEEHIVRFLTGVLGG